MILKNEVRGSYDEVVSCSPAEVCLWSMAAITVAKDSAPLASTDAEDSATPRSCTIRAARSGAAPQAVRYCMSFPASLQETPMPVNLKERPGQDTLIHSENHNNRPTAQGLDRGLFDLVDVVIARFPHLSG